MQLNGDNAIHLKQEYQDGHEFPPSQAWPPTTLVVLLNYKPYGVHWFHRHPEPICLLLVPTDRRCIHINTSPPCLPPSPLPIPYCGHLRSEPFSG